MSVKFVKSSFNQVIKYLFKYSIKKKMKRNFFISNIKK